MESHSAGGSFSLNSLWKKDVESDDCGSTEKDGFAGEILTVEHVSWR